MANLFYAGKMLSQDADSQVVNALYQEAGVDAAVKDGSLVVLGDLAEDLTYAANGDYHYDLYKAEAPAAVTDKVAILDFAGISGGEINENYYKLGVKLFNLEAEAGEPVRARRLFLGDRFWLGEDNFESKPVVGEYAELKVGSCKADPKASHTPGQFGLKIRKEQDLNAGMELKGKMYLCEVIDL